MPKPNFPAVFEALGRKGARDASSWARATETWLDDGLGPMPTEAEAVAKWDEIKQALEDRPKFRKRAGKRVAKNSRIAAIAELKAKGKLPPDYEEDFPEEDAT